jgi:hypothetical protein
MPDRPAVPAPIKRQLRQEAAFGCCVCGNPLIQYHHIVPYAEDQHFRPEDMMALCPNHHVAANQGAIAVKDQRKAKTEPYNNAQGHVRGQLYVNQRDTHVNLGGHLFKSSAGVLLQVDSEPLISTALSSDWRLLLDVRLYGQDDHLLAEIVENEWISHEPLPWDIDFGLQTLSVRSAARKIALGINARAEPVEIRGELWYRGRSLKAANKTIVAGGATLTGGSTIVNGALRLRSDEGGVSIGPMRQRMTKAEQVAEQARQRHRAKPTKKRPRRR